MCCIKTKVETAKMLGLLLAVLSLSLCIKGEAEYIISGIVLTLIHSILIFGAQKRNTSVILLWMVLAVLNLLCIIVAFITIICRIAHNFKGEGIGKWKNGGIIMGIVEIYVGIVIWTIFAAKIARTSILEEEKHFENMKTRPRVMFENVKNSPSANFGIPSQHIPIGRKLLFVL